MLDGSLENLDTLERQLGVAPSTECDAVARGDGEDVSEARVQAASSTRAAGDDALADMQGKITSVSQRQEDLIAQVASLRQDMRLVIETMQKNVIFDT